MTAEETLKVKETITEAIEQLSTVVTVVADELDENPDMLECITEIFAKHRGLWLPIIGELTRELTAARKEAFIDFKQMGLSDEHAVKMVCGR